MNLTIADGDTKCAFTEDVSKRFEAYGWHVQHVPNGDTDLEGIEKAIAEAKKVTDKPSMIKLTTTIGFGSVLQGTGGVHGNPLKADDCKQVKEKFGFDPEKMFQVPQEVYDMYHKHAAEGAAAEEEWNKLFQKYGEEYKDLHADLARRLTGALPEGWQKALPTYKPTDAAIASRKLSESVLEAIHDVVPELLSGSADLTGSNNTRWKKAVDFQPPELGIGEWSGRYLRYGVREHAMAAVMNGMSAYGTIIPAGGTFLNFMSYAAGAARLSSLSHQRVIYVATHDSIGLGEDGPTHQPIETLAHFRALPNMMVWRPADGNECSAAYYMALTSKGTPSILALTRQNLPQLEGSTLEKAIKGGYVALEDKEAQITLVSTGSEVSLCLEAVKTLKEQGIPARVASLPCFEVFDAQDKEYKMSVIPGGIPSLSVEVMSTMGWEKYSHEQFGLNRFGASGPYKEVYKVSTHEMAVQGEADANGQCRSLSSRPRALPSGPRRRLTSTRRSSLCGLLWTGLSSSSSECVGSRGRGWCKDEGAEHCRWTTMSDRVISGSPLGRHGGKISAECIECVPCDRVLGVIDGASGDVL